MQRTRIIGIGLIIIGIGTTVRFTNAKPMGKSLGMVLGFTGVFLLWNAYVARYNDDISFAIFG